MFLVTSPGLNVKKNVWEIETRKADFSRQGSYHFIRKTDPMYAHWMSPVKACPTGTENPRVSKAVILAEVSRTFFKVFIWLGD